MNPSISLLKADNIWGLRSIRPADNERKQTPHGARFASTEERPEHLYFPTFTSSMVLLEKFMYWALSMKMAAAKMRTLMKSNLYLSSSLPLLSILRTISNSQVLVTTVKIFFLLFFSYFILIIKCGVSIHLCRCPETPEEGAGSCWPRATEHGFWESDSGPPQQSCMLLSARSCLQPRC